jgi:putative membrane protein
LAPSLFPAIPASLLELAVVSVWHTPVLHRWARETPAAFALEQATFLAAGLLLWLAAFGESHGGHARRLVGVAALLLTSIHMTLIGALFALSPRPLYGDGTELMLHALDDQHLGGAIMLLVGGASYLLGGLALLAGVLQAPRSPRSTGLVMSEGERQERSRPPRRRSRFSNTTTKKHPI